MNRIRKTTFDKAKGNEMTPQTLMKNYEKALASQEWCNVEPLMHSDVCVTFSSGTFKGKAEVQEVFETNFASIKDEKYSISDLHWVYEGNQCAVCIFCFHWQGLINEQLCSGGGRGTTVMVNVDEEWKILTEHLGPHPS